MRSAPLSGSILRALLLLLVVPVAAVAQPNLVIDSFSTDQNLIFAIGAGNSNSSSETTMGTDIVGGERDLEVRTVAGAVTSGEVTNVTGSFNFSVAAATTGESVITYDGPDGMPSTANIDATGLGGVDLTQGNSQDGLLVRMVSSDQPGTMIIRVFTDAGNISSFTQPIPVINLGDPPVDFVLPYAGFTTDAGAGADFTNVGAITVFQTGTEIDNRLTLIRTTSLLASTKTDALLIDTDSDGLVGPGDSVRYTVTVSNPDDATNAIATGVEFDLTTPDPNVSLVVGSVTTSQGTVTNGNTAGDTTVTVDIGSIPDAASVTITYDVLLNNPLPINITEIACQGTVTSDTVVVLTDDPDDTTSSEDPTVTPVVVPIVDAIKTDSLQVDADSSTDVSPGDTVRYEVVVSNTGTAPATGTTFTSAVPANTTLVVGSVTTSQGSVTTGNTGGDTSVAVDIGSIAAMTNVTVTFDVTVDDPLPAGVDEIDCQGLVTGTNFPMLDTDDPATAPPDDPTVTPVVAAPDLALSKDDGGATATPGANISYTLTITNNGNEAATAVTLSDDVPANTTFVPGSSSPGWSCAPDNTAGSTCTLAVGTLAGGGASTSRTFVVVVDDPLAAGVTQVVNNATVTTPGDDDPGDNDDSDTTPVDAAPDLALTKDDGGATATPGATITYTLTVTNNGDQDATAVSLTDVVPANTTFAPGSSSPGWSCLPDNSAGSTCTLAIGALAGGGASTSRTFAVVVDDPLAPGITQVANTATVTDPDEDDPTDNEDSDTTPVDAAPDLALDKNDGGTTAEPGETITYTLEITNNGDQDATSVTLSDVVPANTTFAPGSSSPGWSCAPNNSAGSTCTLAVGTLAGGGASTSRTFAVVVDDPLAPGVTQVANTATVTTPDEDDPTDNEDSDTTPIGAAPNLEITKDDGGVTATPGATITYTLTVTNNGDQDANPVTLTDVVPANTTFVPGSSSPGWTCLPDNSAGSTCTLNAGILAGGGASVAFTFAVVVDDPLAAGVSQVANTATVTTPGDADDADNEDSDTTPVDAEPNLTIIKDDGGATVSPGDVVVYELTVINNGDQDATGVEITDVVPANTTFDAASSSPGWTCVPDNTAGSTCTLFIGFLAGGGGTTVRDFDLILDDPLPPGVDEVVNTATVSDPDEVDTSDNEDSDTTPIVDADPEIDSLKAAVISDDVDFDGLADAGDTITYTVTISNTGTQAATAVTLEDALDPDTTLVVGSVTTSRGTVTSGNDPGDTTVGVLVGALPGGGVTATITFDVTVNDPVPEDKDFAINQGDVTGGNIDDQVTDDPSTVEVDDPTEVPIGQPVVVDPFEEIPTLDQYGLMAMILLLLFGAMRRLSVLR